MTVNRWLKFVFNLRTKTLSLFHELSKDEIGTIRWDVSALIEDIESDFLNELADKDFRFYLVLRI